ncbi:AfsR/SARP family transcriptional regulator [Streptomyces sp. NPDC048483]|uniref:AfsR/SARP family transcriptional regulator n=1 Tax=Streptomyces sp. NPDC048483 TaxID=3154927 RepID=UPI003430D6CB
MRFNILGPLEILRGGRDITPSAEKLRWLLALLVARGSQVVSISSLIDEVWGENPPRSAIATTRGYICQLRTSFRKATDYSTTDSLIVTRPPGYGLRLSTGQVDAKAFEKATEGGRNLLAAGRPREAAQRLGQALGLWRGPVLADLPTGRLLRAHIAHLHEMWTTAQELSITARMQVGLHRELIPELRSLVIEFPFNEWLHGALIEALNRSGRRGEALRAYRDLQRILDDALGLAPSAPLQRLQRQLHVPEQEREEPGLPFARGVVPGLRSA